MKCIYLIPMLSLQVSCRLGVMKCFSWSSDMRTQHCCTWVQNPGQQVLPSARDSPAYLEETMMVDHPILVVKKGEKGVLRVEQHLALTLLLGFCAFVIPVLQSEDLWKGRGKRPHFCLKRATKANLSQAWNSTAGYKTPLVSKMELVFCFLNVKKRGRISASFR